MNETYMNIVLKALAETIQRLQLDVDILRFDNERLKAENKDLKMAMGAPIPERRNNDA